MITHRVVGARGIGVVGRRVAIGGAGLGAGMGAGMCMGLGPVVHLLLGPIGLLTAAGVAGYYLLRDKPEETTE
ncbi:MAG: hypothetical protein HQM12_02510 [SAR324 cluster bacterium]|nr:hypothetical protein [SAR324 cluster bacterium]